MKRRHAKEGARPRVASIALALGSLAIAGCLNPLNAATADRYAQHCQYLVAAGHLFDAEEACRRALINVRLGHLGPLAESNALFNLAQVTRLVGKYAEAEKLYRESLKIEETISPREEVRVARRQAELAIAMLEQARIKETWPIVSQLLPVSDRFPPDQRATMKKLFEVFAAEYRKAGMEPEALQLEQKLKTL